MGIGVRMSRICCRDDGPKKNKTGTYCYKAIFFSRLKIISWGNKQGGLLRKKTEKYERVQGRTTIQFYAYSGYCLSFPRF